MKIKRPSPAMAVAFLALVLAMSGTAFAAVNYARNAGAVDGRSAIGSGVGNKRAAGKLVTTMRHGANKGKIAQRYLDVGGLAHGSTSTFGRYLAVADNQSLAPEVIGGVFGLGALTASCFDQNPAAGKEDPATRVIFANQSGGVINLARSIGGADPAVAEIANGVQTEWTVGGSSTFTLHIERNGVNYFVNGVVRQDGRNTGNGSCLIYGFSLATGGG